MSSGKVMIICLIVKQIKNILLYKMSYYLDPDSYGRNKIKSELKLSNYAIKPDVKKHCRYIDTLEFANKI